MIADFLRKLRPTGPHVLTSIVVDGKTATKTFTDPAEAEKWVIEENATKNVYFSVNPTIKPVDNKTSKTDIAQLDFLHVDVDPREGENFAEERERIRKLLNGSLSDRGIPPPTLIIDSGGGFQAFWRLATPIELNGDPNKIAAAERYNIELANRLGGDKCHDVSRIMRLPHTRNWPTKKKRAKGRTPSGAEVYDWPAAAPYPLSAFTPAPETAEKPSNGSRARVVASTLAGGAGMDVEALTAFAKQAGLTVSDRLLAVIATGTDPVEPGRFPSRSEALFAVCCGLVRARVPDEVILRVITGPNEIAASVKDKPNPRAYGAEQIASAHGKVSEQRAAPSWDRTNKAGEPLPSYWNTRSALRLMGVECRYDRFRDRHLVGAHELQEFSGDFSDHAERILRDEIFRRYGFDPGEINTNKAVLSLCTENRFDSLIDHLDGLPAWDGRARLDSWLIDYCGAESSAYVREAGATWLVAAVVRAYAPGTKFDYMPVLLGGQGVGKSTALRILAGDDFFSDATFLGARDAREVLEVTRGVWILECAELDGMGRRDVSALKATIARTVDTGRPAYARCAVAVPRRYVLAGTTNEERFLQDPTENRRFWPISVGIIDLDGLREVRDQLIAEALARYRSGAYHMTLFGEAATGAKEAQAQRRVVDEGYIERLENLAPTGKRDGLWAVTTEAVYQHLDIPKKDRSGNVPHKVREAMAALGWEATKTPVRFEGGKQRIYVWKGEGKPGDDMPF